MQMAVPSPLLTAAKIGLLSVVKSKMEGWKDNNRVHKNTPFL